MGLFPETTRKRVTVLQYYLWEETFCKKSVCL